MERRFSLSHLFSQNKYEIEKKSKKKERKEESTKFY